MSFFFQVNIGRAFAVSTHAKVRLTANMFAKNTRWVSVWITHKAHLSQPVPFLKGADTIWSANNCFKGFYNGLRFYQGGGGGILPKTCLWSLFSTSWLDVTLVFGDISISPIYIIFTWSFLETILNMNAWNHDQSASISESTIMFILTRSNCFAGQPLLILSASHFSNRWYATTTKTRSANQTTGAW